MKAASIPGLAAAGLGLAVTWPASAATDAGLPAIPLAGPSVLFSLVRVFGALALVFALFLLGIWVFHNWQRLTVGRGSAPKLNVLEVKSLGPRHALYVVGYEEQRFLLSSAPTGVTMLTALPVAGAEGRATASTATPEPHFVDFLLKAVAPK